MNVEIWKYRIAWIRLKSFFLYWIFGTAGDAAGRPFPMTWRWHPSICWWLFLFPRLRTSLFTLGVSFLPQRSIRQRLESIWREKECIGRHFFSVWKRNFVVVLGVDDASAIDSPWRDLTSAIDQKTRSQISDHVASSFRKLQPNASSDPIGVKRLFTERFESYLNICKCMQFMQKINEEIEFFSYDLPHNAYSLRQIMKSESLGLLFADRNRW